MADSPPGASKRVLLTKLYDQFNDYVSQLQSSLRSPSSSTAANGMDAGSEDLSRVPSKLMLDSTISTASRQVRFQSEVQVGGSRDDAEPPRLTHIDGIRDASDAQVPQNRSILPKLEGGNLSFNTFKQLVGPLVDSISGKSSKVNYDMEMEVVEYQGEKSIATIDATYGREKGYSLDEPFEMSSDQLPADLPRSSASGASFPPGSTRTSSVITSASSVPDAQLLGQRDRHRLSRFGVRAPPNPSLSHTQHAAANSARSVVQFRRNRRLGAVVRRSVSIPSLLKGRTGAGLPTERTRGQGIQLSVYYIWFFFVLPLSMLALYNLVPWVLNFYYPRWSQNKLIEIKEELPPVVHLLYPSFMKKSWLRSSFRVGIWAISLGGFMSIFGQFYKGYMMLRALRPTVTRRNRDSYLLEMHLQKYGPTWNEPDDSQQTASKHSATPSYGGLLKWQNRDATDTVLIDETSQETNNISQDSLDIPRRPSRSGKSPELGDDLSVYRHVGSNRSTKSKKGSQKPKKIGSKKSKP